MDVTSNLRKNVIGWGVVILTVVVLSIVLLNFKTGVNYCESGYVYNASADACALSTNQSTTLTTGSGATIISTVNTSVTGFQEPANWIDIVVISLVGIAILGLFMFLLKKKKE